MWLLLRSGADPSLQNYTEGKTPLEKVADPALQKSIEAFAKSETTPGIDSPTDSANTLKGQLEALTKNTAAIHAAAKQQEHNAALELLQKIREGKPTSNAEQKKVLDLLATLENEQQEHNAGAMKAQEDAAAALVAKLQSASNEEEAANVHRQLETLTEQAAAINAAAQASKNNADESFLMKLKGGKGKNAELRKEKQLAGLLEDQLRKLEANQAEQNRKLGEAQTEASALLQSKLAQGKRARVKKRTGPSEEALAAARALFLWLDVEGVGVLDISSIHEAYCGEFERTAVNAIVYRNAR